ncbi:MAG TPA: helix-turn-helix domain-containing protein [Sphingobium sp.]|nr:helix-turn-helix domain-containing protein [Sphingobium sp.]
MTDDVTERRNADPKALAERARMARETCPYLTAKQAAYYLGIAANTLKRLRLQGRGPLCRSHGGNWRYHIDDLDGWSAARKSGEGA